MAKEMPIGTPDSTAAITISTKKTTRLRLPKGFNTGPSFQNSVTRTAVRASDSTAWANSVCRHSRKQANRAIKDMPTGKALARHEPEISSAEVVIKDSS